ncbi:MAG: class I SAM-dependent methyltransferase [bacterium]|nr:class I SAM-dependent methyltransferase [bacterium]
MKNVSCNLCGSTQSRLFFRAPDRQTRVDYQRFNIVCCEVCELVYINPQPEAHELVKYYPENYNPYNTGEIFSYSFLEKKLKEYFGARGKKKGAPFKHRINRNESPRNYLDFGCGGGANLARVRSLHPSWNLYGLDNNQVACENARAKGFEVFCGDIDKLTLPQNFFDEVHMSSVIEHVPDPVYTMRRIHECLKPGGVVYIRTPNFDSFGRVVFRTYWQALDAPRHLFLFTRKTLSRLLAMEDFSIVRVEYKNSPRIDIRSVYYLVGKKDRRISPILWRLVSPFSSILSRCGWGSTIIIVAKKIT